jgi:hypothetical protein
MLSFRICTEAEWSLGCANKARASRETEERRRWKSFCRWVVLFAIWVLVIWDSTYFNRNVV